MIYLYKAITSIGGFDMITEFKGNELIGDVVAKLPKAAEIFKEYKIDFCCGGNRPLDEVIQQQSLEQKEIIEMLNLAYEEMINSFNEKTSFTEMGYSQLIDYILNTHHEYLNKEMPKLRSLVTKILRVHGLLHPELARVHRLFHDLEVELEQHMIKEEEILFPLVKAYDINSSKKLLEEIYRVNNELEAEHEGAGGILKELRDITEGFSAPAGSCTSYQLTYKGLEALEWDLFQHIHLENNILFPRLLMEDK